METGLGRKTGRLLNVRHTTIYQYDHPIPHSLHRLHLRPVHDFRQSLRFHSLWIAPSTVAREYVDKFGNWASRFEILRPYTELSIVAESVVELSDVDPFDFARVPIPRSFPIRWTDAEMKMLAPFQAQFALPRQQFQELFDYAMGFVQRNGWNLLETLFDVNLTLFREYSYVPGCTNLDTTPYEVFRTRRGVCQDFANLFLCLARLLNLPARYVYGYLFTGNTGSPRARPGASHAWIELYIPGAGWKGFDPTNGVLPAVDHIRVGVGRDHRDCTPTAGTLFAPAAETMLINVEINELSGPKPSAYSGAPLGKIA